MKIAILGCGYVGSAAAKFWTHQGHVVTVSTRNAGRLEELTQIATHTHLLTPGSLKTFLKDAEILLIAVAPDTSHDYQKTYLETAKAVIEAQHSANHLKQIIYTSSTSVYGERNGQWVTESDASIPANENCRILLDTENCLLHEVKQSVAVCIYRLAEIIGPGREIKDKLRQRGQLPFPGTGNSCANFIELQDIVSALDFALNNRLKGIYNLCSDEHPTRAELYSAICTAENIPPVIWDPTKQSLHGGNRKVSNQKLKDLGYKLTSYSTS